MDLRVLKLGIDLLHGLLVELSDRLLVNREALHVEQLTTIEGVEEIGEVLT